MGVRLKRVLDALSRFLNAIAAYLILPALALLISVDVSMRYIVNRPIIGSVEGSGLLLLLIFTFGMSYTTQAGHHIRMDLVYDAVPNRIRAFIEVLSMICGLIFFGAIAYQSWHDVQYAMLISELSAELALPIWPFYAVMMVVFGLIAIQVAATTLLNLMSREPITRPSEIEAGAE